MIPGYLYIQQFPYAFDCIKTVVMYSKKKKKRDLKGDKEEEKGEK